MRTEHIAAALALVLAVPSLALAQAPHCTPEGAHCRWWREVGGDNDHERDLRVEVVGGYWAEDRASALPAWVDVRGQIFDLPLGDSRVGVFGAVRFGGLTDWSPVLVTPGVFVRSRRDQTRFQVSVDVAGSSGVPHGNRDVAQRMLLTGMALGASEDLFWIPDLVSGWLVRASLSNRAQLGDSPWYGWLILRGHGGSASVRTPAAGAIGTLTQTSLATIWIELHAGDATSGLRLGARASIGFGAVLPTETLLPLHAELVIGYEPMEALQVELSMGFTLGPVGLLLTDDTSLGTFALPSAMISVRTFPVAWFRDR